MLLLYAVATKKNLSECISQQNYCTYFTGCFYMGIHQTLSNVFLDVFIKIGKLQNSYVLSIAVFS